MIIIEAMKGSIIYESEKGKGTVCTIALPLELQNSL
jgi:two-component system sporulation sensor kinase B